MLINRQWECFVTAARLRSVTRAAEELFLSQPAVSKQIKALERNLGVQLLQHNGRAFDLTPAGEFFYNGASRVLMEARHVVESTIAMAAAGMLRIGYASLGHYQMLAEVAKLFCARYPHIHLEHRRAAPAEVAGLVSTGELDAAILLQESLSSDGSLEFLKLGDDYQGCVVPKNHPLASRDRVSISDLRGSTVVLADTKTEGPEKIFNWLVREEPTVRIMRADSGETSLISVKAGLGIAIKPRGTCLADPGLVFVPLEWDYYDSYGFAFHKGAPFGVQLYIETVKELFGISDARGSEGRSDIEAVPADSDGQIPPFPLVI